MRLENQKKLLLFLSLVCVFFGVEPSNGAITAEELHEQAQQKYKEGDHVAAKRLLSTISDGDFKRLPEAERRLGFLLYTEGKLEEAGKRYESAWKNGCFEALRYAASVRIELSELEWLEENRAALKKNVSRDIKTLDVFMSWYVQNRDIMILKDGFDSAEQSKILEEEETLRNALKVFRHIIENGDPTLLKGK
jgi:tetratricopeptide (TPR) repeat protein